MKYFFENEEEGSLLLKNANNLDEFTREEIQSWIDHENDFKNYLIRRIFTTNFSWSVPCKEAIETIKNHGKEPILDVLAGTGFWAKLLKRNGIKVIASDIHKIKRKNYYHDTKGLEDTHKTIKTKYPDIYDDIKNVRQTKEKILRRNALKIGYDMKRNRINGDILLSWPPYCESFSDDLLSLINIGTNVFYVGEGKGGCTGDLSFHINLETNFKIIKIVELPRFKMIHDKLIIYEKYKNEPIDKKYRGKTFEED